MEVTRLLVASYFDIVRKNLQVGWGAWVGWGGEGVGWVVACGRVGLVG